MYEDVVRRLRKIIKAHKEIYCGSTEESVAIEQAADAIEKLSCQLSYYHGFDGFLMAHGMFGPCEYVSIEPPKEET